MRIEDIDIMIKTRRLKLKFWSLMNHYGIAHAFVVFPLSSIYLYFNGLIRNDLNDSLILFLLLWGIFGAIIATILYIVRNRQLRFTVIPTKLNSAEITNAIDQTAEKWGWEIKERSQRYICAIQKPDIFHNGNRITIILDKEFVLINSISFLPTMFFGSNSDNINTLKKNMMA